MPTKFKEEIRQTVFVKAMRDTSITRMDNPEMETDIPEGTLMFHITSPKQTIYLDSDEICVFTREHGVCYSYRPDWGPDGY